MESHLQLDCDSAFQVFQTQERALPKVPVEDERLITWKHSRSAAAASTNFGFRDEELFDNDVAGQVLHQHLRERVGSEVSNVSICSDSKLSIVLTRLMQSESAESFLCDRSGRGLLDLRMIEQRLDDGRYADPALFWTEIDECFSVCAEAGRYPSVVREMRMPYQLLEKEFWEQLAHIENFLDGVSPAIGSFATLSLVFANQIEKCVVECSSSGVVSDALEYCATGSAGTVDALGNWFGDWTLFGKPEQDV